MDDDKNYLRSPKRRYNDAVKELHVKYLRYPGGWKSDIVFWSKPPFEMPDPTLIYMGEGVWPSMDTTLVNKDGSWRIDPYDFDEFIETCRETGAEPIVVVCYNALRWPGRKGIRKPTKRQIIENAVSWVRYANTVKKYSVKYWEIGNETWLGNAGYEDDAKQAISPSVYGEDLSEIARAMKSVDPAVLIGANGNARSYWEALFDKAADEIDFLSVHAYPLWGWGGYRDYLQKKPDACIAVEEAKASVENHPKTSNRRIPLMVTEFAAGAFNQWDGTGADIARAVITFDLQGQLLQCPDCFFSQFWNTINVYENDNSVFNAFRRENTLTSVGQALSIWGRFLEDEMIATKGTPVIGCFATKTDGNHLAVFAMNKDTVERPIFVKTDNLPEPSMDGEEWVFCGKSADDKDPTFEKKGALQIVNRGFDARLAPVSVTMFRFRMRKQ